MKQQIEVLFGLSCAGKSFYSNNKVNTDPSWKRVNKDYIRSQCPNGIKEKKVIETETALIDYHLNNGFNVIVDSTNLNPVHLERFKNLFGERAEIIENRSFLDVPLETLFERGAQREEGGAFWKKVILGQKNQWLVPKKLYEDPNYYCQDLPKVCIFDLDGSLAIHYKRTPFQFHRCGEDLPNAPMVDIAKMYCERRDVKVICLSGRPDDFREQTEAWLKAQGISHDGLYMRKSKDFRSDVIVKREIYDAEIAGKYLVYAVFDDRRKVVEHVWVELGLPVFAFGNPYHEF